MARLPDAPWHGVRGTLGIVTTDAELAGSITFYFHRSVTSIDGRNLTNLPETRDIQMAISTSTPRSGKARIPPFSR